MATNLETLFSNFGDEQITKDSHLEKLCLIQGGVGKDNISDFTTNLIKQYLLKYTEKFAKEHLDPQRCREVPVSRANFRYETRSWVTSSFFLPWHDGDYVLLTPKYYGDKAKSQLKNASYYIIINSGAYRVEETDEGERFIPLVDTRIIGDVRRLTRIPNTLRPPENLTYCTYLPPEKFTEMSLEDVIRHIKGIHTYRYSIHKMPTLEDFPKVNTKKIRTITSLSPQPISVAPERVKEFLKRILRPCLYKWIITAEPPHEVRVAVTIDLLNMGFTEEEIFKIYQSLNWKDFDPDTTEYQIHHIAEGNYRPYSCRRLRELGIAKVCCFE